MQNIASLRTDEFPALLARLPADLDLDQLAIEHKAIQRGRKIKTGAELPRLALAHGPGGMSLRDAAGWAGMLGMGTRTNPAVKYRQLGGFSHGRHRPLAGGDVGQPGSALAGPYPTPGRQHLHFQARQQR
jgi:hypothetical protein